MNKPRQSLGEAGHQGLCEPNSLSRLLGITAVFVLIGPLAGSLGVNILLSLIQAAQTIATQGSDVTEIIRRLVGGIVVGTLISAMLSYSFGIFAAIGVGLTVALGDRRELGISLKLALTAAFFFWILMSGLVATMVPASALYVWIISLLIGHMLAAWICTGLARRIFGTGTLLR